MLLFTQGLYNHWKIRMHILLFNWRGLNTIHFLTLLIILLSLI